MQELDARDLEQLTRRTLALPGKGVKGVYTSADFMDQLARKRIVRLKGEALVVGNGSDALEAARAAVGLGAEKVTVVCMGPDADMAFTLEEAAEAKADGVRIMHGWAPMRIAGHTDGRTSGVFFKHCDRVFDGDGRFSPKYDTNNTMAQYGDTVILAGD